MNRAQLQRVVEHIEANPDELDMGQWAPLRVFWDEPCNTTCCIAGHTLLLNGFVPVGNGVEFTPPGEHRAVNVRDTAAEILGLTPGQATSLFFSSATAQTLRARVDRMLIDAGQEPLPVSTDG